MENRFGTTSDMIVQEVENNGITQLIAIDSKGLYLTTQDRVNRMLEFLARKADPKPNA
ncbi:hypothetical protein [uncultured Desulfobacter sp.]|uniref:hypothetical protein n=1 Tax=uncultured Desulfobacter sp. TaxID=240139 RepID=UPI0029F59DFC|nr:hypothetical protein [uncultured Desulfobacter sp.]